MRSRQKNLNTHAHGVVTVKKITDYREPILSTVVAMRDEETGNAFGILTSRDELGKYPK